MAHRRADMERRVDPTPGDVGRFALHADPQVFGRRLIEWCDSSEEVAQILDWWQAVYLRLHDDGRDDDQVASVSAAEPEAPF